MKKKNYKVKLKVKELLEERNITQKKLAQISGIRESTISDIVRGTRAVINFEHLSKIAEALEIDNISQLIDFEEIYTNYYMGINSFVSLFVKDFVVHSSIP